MSKKSKVGINTRKVGSFLALLSFTAYMPISTMPAFAEASNWQLAPNALPDLIQAANGEVSGPYTNDQGLTQMDAKVNGGAGSVAQFDWNTFNVGKDAQFNTVFTANSQTALNRVLATGGAAVSYIYGKMTASSANGCAACTNTGKVILINPNGIIFGNGSSVDLNSFTASTFDIKDVKNLKDLEKAGQLNDYIKGTNGFKGLNKLAGYNTTVHYVPDSNGEGGWITAQGAVFNTDKTGLKSTQNKTVAMVAKNVNIIDGTKISTKYESAPANTQNGTQTRSGVKLVTGDGVNFYYTSAGDINQAGLKSGEVTAVKTDKAKMTGINISDSEIRTGDLEINDAAGNWVTISNSKLYTKKLLGTDKATYAGQPLTPEQSGEYGNISIEGRNTVSITNSEIQTSDDFDADIYKNTGKKVAITSDMTGGKITINSDEKLTIKNSKVQSVNNSTKFTDANGAGNVSLASKKGNVNITGSEVISGGNMSIAAAGDLVANNAEIIAAGQDVVSTTNNSFTKARKLNITAGDAYLEKTLLNADTVNVDSGDIISAKDSNLVATTKLNLLGQNTTLDNSLVQYKDISLFNSDSKVNNVTLANGTTVNDKDSDGLVLTTNGNLTVDNTALNKKAYNSNSSVKQKFVKLTSTKGDINIQNKANVSTDEGKIELTAKGNVNVDNATVNAELVANNSLAVDAKNDALIINANNVNVKNAGKVKSKNGDIKIVANNNVTVNASEIYGENGYVDITATNGKVTAKGTSAKDAKIVSEGYPTLTRGGLVKITQGKDIDLNNDFGNSLVGGTGTGAQRSPKLVLTSKGQIKGVDLVNSSEDIGAIKSVKTLKDTSKNARFTLSNDAEMHAKSINLAGKSDLTLTNVTTDSTDGTVIAAAGKLNLNDLNIKNGPTTLEGAQIATPNGEIKANDNKVKLNSPGNIDINISGVTNADNGLEVNADISTGTFNPDTNKQDNNYSQNKLIGRHVKINATDGKLAISKIKADTLNIKADKIIEGKANITRNWDHVSGFSDKEVADMNGNKAYIEVKTDGGFNIDPSTEYGNPNVEYIKNRANTSNSEHLYGDWSEAKDGGQTVIDPGYTNKRVQVGGEKYVKVEGTEQETGNHQDKLVQKDVVVEDWKTENIYDENGKIIGTKEVRVLEDEYSVKDQISWTEEQYANYQYETKSPTVETAQYKERTHDVKTTTVSKEHTATIKDGKTEGFVLVYSKKSETTTPQPNETQNLNAVRTGGQVTRSEVKVEKTGESQTAYGYKDPRTEMRNRRIETRNECLFENDVPPKADPVAPNIDPSTLVRNPRHSEGTSNSAPVQNDLADTTSTVVAAAARLQLDDSNDDEEELDY